MRGAEIVRVIEFQQCLLSGICTSNCLKGVYFCHSVVLQGKLRLSLSSKKIKKIPEVCVVHVFVVKHLQEYLLIGQADGLTNGLTNG